jgi:hypothetical protein
VSGVPDVPKPITPEPPPPSNGAVVAATLLGSLAALVGSALLNRGECDLGFCILGYAFIPPYCLLGAAMNRAFFRPAEHWSRAVAKIFAIALGVPAVLTGLLVLIFGLLLGDRMWTSGLVALYVFALFAVPLILVGYIYHFAYAALSRRRANKL